MWLLDIIKVIILGIVEGITEWLPVSSNPHHDPEGPGLLRPAGREEQQDLHHPPRRHGLGLQRPRGVPRHAQ